MLDYPYLDDDLADTLEGPEPEWSMEPEQESPPDLARVSGMLWRLRRLLKEQRGDELVAEQQHQQIDAWLARRSAPRSDRVEWLRRSLRAYHEGMFARSKQATISLPAGELASKAQQPEWQFTDEAAFLAWAKEHCPAAVRQKERPPAPPPEIDKAGAKAALTRRDEKGKALEFGITPEGERPPGLLVVSRDRDYDVRFPQEEQL